MKRKPVVTIDGPAGAGKSTVARALAKRLGLVYLDTGAIYRTVALAAQRAGASWECEQAVAAVAKQMVERADLRFEAVEAGAQRVVLGGEDVSEAIRTPEISRGSSIVSAHPSVRAELLALQRSVAADGGVVVEGRDTGTVVFPDAEVKIFMTASAQERARRRCLELQAKGTDADFAATLREIEDRDRRDTQRQTAPLRRAEDAVEVDTTGLPIDVVVDRMAALVP